MLGLSIKEDFLKVIFGLSSHIKETIDIIKGGVNNFSKLSKAEIIKNEILRDCNNDIFLENANELYNEWRTIKAKWFLPRYFAKKQYINKIRRYNPLIIEQEINDFLSKLMEYKELHNEIVKIQNAINHYFESKYENETLPNVKEADIYIEKLNNWINHIGEVRDWYHWCAYKTELEDKG